MNAGVYVRGSSLADTNAFGKEEKKRRKKKNAKAIHVYTNSTYNMKRIAFWYNFPLHCHQSIYVALMFNWMVLTAYWST